VDVRKTTSISSWGEHCRGMTAFMERKRTTEVQNIVTGLGASKKNGQIHTMRAKISQGFEPKPNDTINRDSQRINRNGIQKKKAILTIHRLSGESRKGRMPTVQVETRISKKSEDRQPRTKISHREGQTLEARDTKGTGKPTRPNVR